MFDDNRVIAMARSLGLALQQEETFRNYFEAKRKNDEDVLLQNMIDDFNELQRKLDVAFSKDEKDTEEIEVLSNDMNRLYQAIMENENMVNYNEMREPYDTLTKYINRILLVAMNGGDPFAVKETDCTGNCSTCGGCG